ncbi:hypothetical protein RHMOL_Rhmol03G0248800 [Rhododendron molle]|uniref:Uncharacterized protein n=1 Tax=Rhododendron molle TaxID=49168 RepID=A0ACC0PJG4_RHOML|nr:hypothetical protein RHMOL_Rhmol03G0248800 [Rhododendron molle]
MIHQPNPLRRRPRPDEAFEQDFQNPLAGGGVGLDAGGVEDLRHQVAAEEPPRGAVPGRADAVLVAADDFSRGEGLEPVGEDGAVLDEGLVGQGGGADEDGRAGTDPEGDDGAVFGQEGTDGGFEFGEISSPEEYEAADKWDGGGSRGEVLLLNLVVGSGRRED